MTWMRITRKQDLVCGDFDKILIDKDGRPVTIRYDIQECHKVPFISFEDLPDGLYTYVISSSERMLVAKVDDPFERGSKHLQLVHASDESNFLVGGEIHIQTRDIDAHKVLTYNVYSGLFESNTDFNISHFRYEFFEMIRRVFESHALSREGHDTEKVILCYTVDQLVTGRRLSKP